MKNFYNSSIIGILSLSFLLFFGNSFSVIAQSGTATVTTDKDDYAPGEYVIITGSGWEPGERVDFTFEETPKPETCVNSHDNFAIADANGDIFYDGFLIKPNHVGVAFELTATGFSSKLIATAFFTDANSSVSNTSPSSGSNGTIVILSARLTQVGNDNSCVLCVGNGNPIPGKTINFSLNNVLLGSGITDFNGVATFNWTVNQPVGSYNGNSGLKAEFLGDPSNDPYAGKSETKNFTISCGPPSIISDPTAKNITYGDPDPTFSVTATGTGLSYQWQYNTVALPGTWNNVGSNSSSYTVPSPDVSFSGRTYRVLITGTCGTVTSSSVGLTVNMKNITGNFTASNKIYDGNTSSTVSVRTLTGVLAGDIANVTLTGGTATFADKNVGNGKTVTLAGASLVGTAAGNYNLTSVGTSSADISQAAVVVSITADDKTYDATVDATVAVSGISGILLSDDVTASASNGEFDDKNVGTDKTVTADIATAGDDAGNYSFNATATTTADITEASTAITVQNSLADCEGDNVTFTATVNTVNQAIQDEVNNFGGIVTFKNGSTTIGTVTAESVTGGIFSDTFPISLPLGAIYSITAEYVPYSGNLTGSQTTNSAQLTVMKATISSSVPKNANDNVVIFDGAASSLGLPSSTTLTATYQPSPYSGVTYKWYATNEAGSFILISGSTSSTYQVVANGDFVKEYKVELIVNGQCVGNEIFSKVISVEASCGKAGQNKVQVCHIMPNGKRNTICVSANAVEALLAGSPGSFIGNCNVTYRMEEEPELISVPWNTPLEVINDKIVSQSENWFDSKKIKLTINSESYNALQPGFYEMKINVADNEWFALEEPITVNVLVADKPLATDVKLSNSIIFRNIQIGSVIGDLSTIDPVDDQHTYSIAEQSDFEISGKSLIWKGTEIPASARITVFSTDRAGQTIERAIELSREPRFGDFIMFPNPASSEVNLEVELEQSMNVGIRIYDAVGRLVFEGESVQNGVYKHQINIDHLSPGLYTVQLKTGQLVMNKRLIKK